MFLFISDTLHPTKQVFPQAVTLHLIIIFLQQDKPLIFLVKKLTFTLNVLELFWELPSKGITSFNNTSFQFLFNFSSPIWPIKIMFSLTRLIFFHNFLIETYSPSRYMWNVTCLLFKRNCFFLYLKYYTGKKKKILYWDTVILRCELIIRMNYFIVKFIFSLFNRYLKKIIPKFQQFHLPAEYLRY